LALLSGAFALVAALSFFPDAHLGARASIWVSAAVVSAAFKIVFTALVTDGIG
jgi:hypothetical protein